MKVYKNLILKLNFDSNVDLHLIIWKLLGIFIVSRGLEWGGMAGHKPHAEATKQRFNRNICQQKINSLNLP